MVFKQRDIRVMVWASQKRNTLKCLFNYMRFCGLFTCVYIHRWIHMYTQLEYTTEHVWEPEGDISLTTVPSKPLSNLGLKAVFIPLSIHKTGV